MTLRIVAEQGYTLHHDHEDFASLNAALDMAPPGGEVVYMAVDELDYVQTDPVMWDEPSRSFVSAWDRIALLSDNMKLWVCKLNDIPEHALVALSKDESYVVRYWIAMDTNAPEHVLWDLAGDSDDSVRMAVAENASASEGLLRYLANSESEEIRRNIASNPSAPVDLINSLAEDESVEVANTAKKHRKYAP